MIADGATRNEISGFRKAGRLACLETHPKKFADVMVARRAKDGRLRG